MARDERVLDPDHPWGRRRSEAAAGAARIKDVARLAGVSTATVSRALATPERVSPEARARVLVSGVVQGVWFRESTRGEADRLGVAGWVRNLPDGRVEAAFEGPADAVGAMVSWCSKGPPNAVVERVEVAPEDPEGIQGPFRVLR